MADQFIKTEQALNSIIEAYDRHKIAVQQNVTVLMQLNQEYAKLPSDFISAQQQIIEADKRQISTKQALAEAIKNENQARQSDLKTLQEQERLKQQTLRTQATESRTKAASIRLQETQVRQQNRINRELEREQRQLQRTTGMYNMVQQRVTALTREYNNLATRKELNNDLTVLEEARLSSLESRLQKYLGVLNKVDNNIGNFRRNVGNYGSAWNGLGNSLNQLTREAPAFANSIQTGFLAISNNLPILVDEINRLNEANKALVAQGQPTTSVLRQIASALFSWQTALSIGVTLLTIYGKDLVTFARNLFTAEKATESVGLSQERLNEIFEATGKAVGAQITELDLLGDALNDVTQSEENREKALQRLQQLYPTYFNNLNLEKSSLQDISTAIQQVTKDIIQQAFVKAVIAEIEEEAAKLAEAQKEAALQTNQLRQESRDVAPQLEIERLKLEQLRATLRQNREERFLSEEQLQKLGEELINQANIVGRLELVQRRSQRQESEIQKALQARENTTTELINRLKELIDTEDILGNFQDQNIKKNEETKTVVDGSLQSFQELRAQLVDQRDRLATTNEEYEKYTEQIRLVDVAIKFLTTSFKPLTELQDLETEKLKENTEAFDEFSRMVEQTEETIRSFKAEAEGLISDVSFAFLDDAGLGSLTAFFDGTFETLNAGLDSISDNSERTMKKFALNFQLIGDAAQEVFSFITQLDQQRFQMQLQNLEQERDVALQFAGESESARIAIEEQFDRRRAQIQQKQAEANKKNTLFNIAINTAQGITAALASVPPNIPLSVAIGLIGAAQAAAVAGREIPAFRYGGETKEAGNILVNDAPGMHYKEVVETSNMFMFPKERNTVMKVPKNTKIHKNYGAFMEQLNNTLFSNNIAPASGELFGHTMQNIITNGGSITKKELYEVMSTQTEKMVRAYQNTKGLQVNIDKNGFNASVKNGLSRKNVLNNRFQFRGQKV